MGVGVAVGVGVGVTAGITISCAVAECAYEDPDPVTVIVYVPGAAVPAYMFSVEVLPVVTTSVVNEPDAPAGSGPRVKLICSALPEITAVLTV